MGDGLHDVRAVSNSRYVVKEFNSCRVGECYEKFIRARRFCYQTHVRHSTLNPGKYSDNNNQQHYKDETVRITRKIFTFSRDKS